MKDLVAFRVDRLALAVDHVVELDDALADVEVEALDARLRALDRARHELRLDGHVLVQPQALHEPGHPFVGEALHEVVIEREVEPRRARVALSAGAATQLVVDAPRVVALRADDVQPTDRHDVLVLGLGLRPRLGERRVVDRLLHLGRVEALLVERLGRQAGRVAAELDVRAAAGHVGGDGHGTGASGLGHHAGFPLVLFRVQGLVLDPSTLEHRGEDLGLLDAHRADQDRPPDLLHLDDLIDERIELGLLVAEDEVRSVLADHLLVGRDRHDLEVVDLVELFGLGHRGAGHARELVVEPEVVLEGDRGQGHALVGLHRVQPVAADVDDAARVEHRDVPGTGREQEVRARHTGRAGTGDDDPLVFDRPVEHRVRAAQRGQQDDGRAVLVVVHDRAVQRLDQPALQLEATRCGHVLQVHRAERRPQANQGLDDLVHVGRVEHERDRVQPAEGVEQRGLALHHGQCGAGADVTEAEHRGAVADHGHQSVRPGVLLRERGVLGDRAAHLGHTGGVGDRQRTRVGDRPRHRDVELAALVGGEDLLVGDVRQIRFGQGVVHGSHCVPPAGRCGGRCES